MGGEMKISEIDKLVADNILIARFMGWKIDNSFPDKDRVWKSPGGRTELDTTLKFHKDWSWVMSVVERLLLSDRYGKGAYENNISYDTCFVYGDINKTHKEVVKLIKYLNDKVD